MTTGNRTLEHPVQLSGRTDNVRAFVHGLPVVIQYRLK